MNCSDNGTLNNIKENSLKEIIDDDWKNNDVRIIGCEVKPNEIEQLNPSNKHMSSDKENNNKTISSGNVNSFKVNDGPAIVSVTTLNHTEINSIIEDNKIVISDDEDL